VKYSINLSDKNFDVYKLKSEQIQIEFSTNKKRLQYIAAFLT